MCRVFIIFATTALLLACNRPAVNTQAETEPEIYPSEDQEILARVIENLHDGSQQSISELVVRVGKSFTGFPYVAHTLEREQEELVVNLRELDCTTYAENCLAIARTIRSDKPTFDSFRDELRLIRYRDGILDHYPSRLHYFCDWIQNNEKSGLVRDISRDLGGIPLDKEINFMSQHPRNYPQLEADSSMVQKIKAQELEINSRVRYYIPESEIGEIESRLNEGDIVGITTDIGGLAVMHVGILVRQGDRIHLMHASSAMEEVVISEESLEAYLLAGKRATGIIVARPQ